MTPALPEILIIHATVPGRLRLRMPALRDAAERAASLELRLRAVPGIQSATINVVTGSILLRHVPALSAGDLVKVVQACTDPSAGGARTPTPPVAVGGPNPVADNPAWHALPIGELRRRLDLAGLDGLSMREAEQRLLRHGPNRLPRPQPRGALALFVEQLTSLPVLLLAASAAVSLATGGLADAAVIAVVVIANAAIATATESQAERTILAMDDVAVADIRVLRDGTPRLLAPDYLVPGDVVPIEAGMVVPADLRLLRALDLTVNESALTGESLPVEKQAEAMVADDTALAERATMLHRGSAVTGGSGTGLVVATGPTTEIGRLQALLSEVQAPPTPIQRELDSLGRRLVWINGAICLGVMGLSLLRGGGLVPALRGAISLAVAAVPEGLPAVATTTLAVGIRQMSRQGVLVRRLDAIETLGAVRVVCLDKTGTLTRNIMAVVAARLPAGACVLASDALAAADGADPDACRTQSLRMFSVASLCSDVGVDGPRLQGSPTETALVRSAIDLGVDVPALREAHPRIATAPRAEGRKRMATLHATADGRRLLAVKGDPAEVLALCDRQLHDADAPRPLTPADRAAIRAANDAMAGQALRVLGVAFVEAMDDPAEENLIWCGLAGIADPLRQDARSAIDTLHAAGVRTAMITGDQAATAVAIARSLDLGGGGEITVLEAGQLDAERPEMLAALAPKADAFARVSPAQKLHVVRALQAGGDVVAMTGDGINDGPALRAADIGIAMGAGGTEAARQASDIVLADDDLNAIPRAVALGRSTTSNIRKVLRYLVSTNLSESIVMLVGVGIGVREPLSPIQLLWLNLLSDVAPALALGLDPPEGDELTRPPRDLSEPLLGSADLIRQAREGGVIAGATLLAQLVAGGGAANAPVAFHAITLAQLLHALACRSDHDSLVGLLRHGRRNDALLGAVGGGLALQAAAQTLPPLRRLLGLGPMTVSGLLASGFAGVGALVVNEAISAAARNRQRARGSGDVI